MAKQPIDPKTPSPKTKAAATTTAAPIAPAKPATVRRDPLTSTPTQTAKRTGYRDPSKAKGIDVALQGGGAHGAFTWGVLDYFLERDDVFMDGICGTSAGALNGTLLAYGLMMGGREKAREMLHDLWYRVSLLGDKYPMFKPTPMDKYFGNGNLDYSPAYKWLEYMMQFSSPYDWNRSDANPLRDMLLEMVDFDKLRSCEETSLFVCATNVRNGRLRVFSLKDITIDSVMASACLPFLFKAVEIGGEFYWDGGYMGNPPLFPLIDHTDTGDVLIVQINPINVDDVPRTASEIHDRINEISFNASLMLELRKIRFIDRLQEMGVDLSPLGKDLKKVRLHLINPEETIAKLNISSKLNTDWDFLTGLRDIGRRYAQDFLDRHFDDLGKKSTCDIEADYLR